MTSYAPTILTWADIDAGTLARIEHVADATHVTGMHDARVDVIVSNAFNGMGDMTGSDEFGYSVAWLDLADHLEADGADLPACVDYQTLGAYLATWCDVAGSRYVLAYWEANGSRSAVGYDTRDAMMSAYRDIEAEFIAWEV